MMIHTLRPVAAFLLLAAAISVGCRGLPTGLAIAAARDSIRLADVRDIEKDLVGKPEAAADERFGQRFALRHDELSGDNLIFYPIASLPTMEHFHVVRVGPSGEITAVSAWLRNADGLEDLFKLLVVKGRVVGKPIDESQASAKLKDPVLVLSEDGVADRWYVFDVSNFTHYLPRVLQLTVDGEGRCTRADYFGAISRWDRPTESGDSKAADPADSN